MAPGRVDHTISLARQLGVLDRLRCSPRRRRTIDCCGRVHTPDYIEAVAPRDCRTSATGSAPPTTRSSPACTRCPPRSSMATVEAARQVWPGEVAAGQQHRRRPAPRDAGPDQRLLRLQRPRGGHPLAAGPRLRAGRVRRRRRPPRRRGADDLLRRPPGADGQPARDAGLPVPRHRVPDRDRRPGRARQRGQRRPAAGHRRRRLAAGLPRGRAGRCCARYGRRCWSPSTAATPTATTRSPTWSSALDGQRASYLALAELADELCEGRWVSTGGGGYAVLDVVPRAWTHLLGHRQRRAGRSRDAHAAGLAGRDRARAPADDDRRGGRLLRPVRRRLPPRQPGRPGHHGHPDARSSPSWASTPASDT